MWTQELFGVEKPIIALLHLDAMPGDPGFCGKLETVLAHAQADLEALQAGGVDGILFANEFSRPYQAVPDIAMISAMAYIIGNLRSVLDRPFGVNVVKNPIATIDLTAFPALTQASTVCSPPAAARLHDTGRLWGFRE